MRNSDLDGRYRLDSSILRSTVDGSLLLYDPRTVEVHEPNETMAALIGMADRGLSLEEMVVELAEGYDLDLDAAAEAVLAAIVELGRAKLLVKV